MLGQAKVELRNRIGSVIGGDADEDGKHRNIGSEPTGEGSDVNLVTGDKEPAATLSWLPPIADKSGDESLEQDSLFESDPDATWSRNRFGRTATQ